MAKGLRSKIKRHFRTQKRATVSENPTYLKAEQQKQEILQAIVEAPKPEHGSDDPQSSERMQGADEGDNVTESMAIDDTDLTTKNPARLVRKLRARRLATIKGTKAPLKKKKNPLGGANQFHKKKGKKKR